MAGASTLEDAEQAPFNEGIFYFAYGPMVNEMVRERRGIAATEIQPAYLCDYRLTFYFGGNANILAKRGYEVHGLLMKLTSKDDWEKVCHCDEGLAVTTRSVIPYSSTEELSDDRQDADDDFCAASIKGAIQAHLIELPKHVEDAVWESPLEILPQERYLTLIAQGMRQYNVDEDYITDQIEACPFIPKCKPENFASWPSAKRVPVISFKNYTKLCAKGKDLYFCIGKRVFRCSEHDPVNPAAQWINLHCHGKPDCTYKLHVTMVDPDIPLVHDPKDVTPLHLAWAENHACEVLGKFKMSATRVYELEDLQKEKTLPRSTRAWCRYWVFRPWKKLCRQSRTYDEPTESVTLHCSNDTLR